MKIPMISYMYPNYDRMNQRIISVKLERDIEGYKAVVYGLHHSFPIVIKEGMTLEIIGTITDVEFEREG